MSGWEATTPRTNTNAWLKNQTPTKNMHEWYFADKQNTFQKYDAQMIFCWKKNTKEKICKAESKARPKTTNPHQVKKSNFVASQPPPGRG